MLSQAQVGMKGRESVGQLYTRDLTAQTVLIELATRFPPRVAGWARVQFDPKKALEETQELFARGLHWLVAYTSGDAP